MQMRHRSFARDRQGVDLAVSCLVQQPKDIFIRRFGKKRRMIGGIEAMVSMEIMVLSEYFSSTQAVSMLNSQEISFFIGSCLHVLILEAS